MLSDSAFQITAQNNQLTLFGRTPYCQR